MPHILRIDELSVGLRTMGWNIFSSSERVIQMGADPEQGRLALNSSDAFFYRSYEIHSKTL